MGLLKITVIYKSNLKKISKNKSSKDNSNSTFKENLLTTLFQKELMIIIGIPTYFSYSTRQVSLPHDHTPNGFFTKKGRV